MKFGIFYEQQLPRPGRYDVTEVDRTLGIEQEAVADQ